MATVTFTVDPTLLEMIIQAACYHYGYQAEVPDPANPGATIPNPQSRGEFTQQVIVRFCNDLVTSYKAHTSAEVARQQAIADVQSQVAAAPPTDITVTP